MKVKSLKEREYMLPGVIYVLKIGDEIDVPPEEAAKGVKAGEFTIIKEPGKGVI